MKINWTLVWEAVKEPLRELVLAIIPIVMVSVNSVNAPWAAILYLVLRAVDAYLHEVGKTTKDDSLITGITRF